MAARTEIAASERAMVVIERPDVPANWDYKKSVRKTKRAIYKWKSLTVELATELWIAREKLSHRGNPNWNKSSNSKTWSDYCEEIGSTRQVVNRWLAAFFPSLNGDDSEPNPWSLYDGLEAIDGSVRKVLEQWPAEYVKTLGEKLISLGEEIRDTGGLA